MKRRPPRIKKRGAIELSMNTIVVIVIGITLLTLGLRWVYNIFSQIEEQREKLAEATEEQIRRTFGESGESLNLLTSSVEIEQGKFKDLGVGIRNILTEEHSFQYTIDVVDAPAGVEEEQVLGWLRWDKSEIRLKSGELYTDAISMDPKDFPLGVYKLKIKLECVDPGCDERAAKPLTIRIVAK